MNIIKEIKIRNFFCKFLMPLLFLFVIDNRTVNACCWMCCEDNVRKSPQIMPPLQLVALGEVTAKPPFPEVFPTSAEVPQRIPAEKASSTVSNAHNEQPISSILHAFSNSRYPQVEESSMVPKIEDGPPLILLLSVSSDSNPYERDEVSMGGSPPELSSGTRPYDSPHSRDDTR